MEKSEVLEGRSRIAVFHMFGVVFAYAVHHLDERRQGEVAIIGPLTLGVRAGHLREMARKMCRPGASDEDQAAWIMTQANRAFICGDLLARFEDAGWKLEPGGKRSKHTGMAARDELWTGSMTVEGTTPEMVAPKPHIYPA